MNAIDEKMLIRRIVVGIDASPHSLLALDSVAQLAARLHVELVGVFVEDINLLRTVEFPFAREVNRLSGAVQPIDRTGIDRQLKFQARQAQQALEKVARECQVACSFRVVRGGVSQELIAAAEQEDLVTLGRVGWSSEQRLGSTAQAIMARGRCMTLLHNSQTISQLGLTILFDGSVESEKALLVGVQISAGRDVTVMVLAIQENDFREKQKQAEVILGGAHKVVQFQSISDWSELKWVSGQDIVIVPVAQSGEVLEHLDRLDCSILLVR